MDIYLVRHGIAEDVSPLSGADSQRRLTPEGQRKTAKVAEEFHKRISSIDCIFHSPFLRAKETAEIFSERFEKAKLTEVKAFRPDDDPRDGLIFLEKQTQYDQILLVSHEPYLGRLASLLLSGDMNLPLSFKKAGIAGFRWQGAGESSLLFWMPPRMLQR